MVIVEPKFPELLDFCPSWPDRFVIVTTEDQPVTAPVDWTGWTALDCQLIIKKLTGAGETL